MLYDKTIILSALGIDNCITEIRSLQPAGLDSRTFSRVTLTLDELLLRCSETYGPTENCKVSLELKKDRLRVCCMVKGVRRNPLLDNTEEKSIGSGILTALGLSPVYRYASGNNIIRFSYKKSWQMSFFLQIILAFLLAVISGFLLRLAPESVCNVICNDFFTPLFSKLISIFSAVASPLIFLAILLSIQSMGSVQSFGRVGKQFLKGITFAYLLAVIVAALFNIPVYGLAPAGSTTQSGLNAVVDMVLDIFPSNLFVPFNNGNDLQIVTIAIFFGIVMLPLQNAIGGLVTLLEQFNVIIQKLMLLICKTLPVIVYLSIVCMIADGSLAQIGDMYKPIVLFFCSSFFLTAIILFRAVWVTKASPLLLLKKHLPTFLITFTTSSSVAALPLSTECCKDKLGVDASLVNFAMPFGMVTYMPNGALYLIIATIYCGSVFNVPFTLTWLLTLLFIGVVIAIAAPPIPGSAFVVMSVMLASMGVPDEALPIAVILNTICGYFLPAFNTFCLQMEIIIAAQKLELLNHDTLNSPTF